MATSRHGSAVRGMDNVPHSSIRDQRFGRMFRYLPAADFPEAALVALADTMFARRRSPNASRPGVAGGRASRSWRSLKTTIRPSPRATPISASSSTTTSPSIRCRRSTGSTIPTPCRTFRTPRLDLDSVYGSGPDDQPLSLRQTTASISCSETTRTSIAPQAPGPTCPAIPPAARRALIGDKRNDENLIVSQLHATFLRFHNRVLRDGAHGGDFALAQQIVRWHYQWIVLHDFIPRIVGPATYQEVIGGRGGMPVHRLL